MPFGKCCICTMPFDNDTMSSLKCGHTYHHGCISTWLRNKRDCPKCRKKALAKEIIQLFIDEKDADVASVHNANHEETVAMLESRLTAETHEKMRLQDQVSTLTRQNTVLHGQMAIANENVALLAKKQLRIESLEKMIVDQKRLEKELSETKARMLACDFYQVLRKNSTANFDEKELDRFVGPGNKPNMDVFLSILQRDLKKAEEKYTGIIAQLQHDVKKNEQEARHYKLVANTQKREVDRLTHQLSHARASTPGNATSSPDFMQRVSTSFGFSPRVDSGIGRSLEVTKSEIKTPEKEGAFNFRIETPGERGARPTGAHASTSFSPEILHVLMPGGAAGAPKPRPITDGSDGIEIIAELRAAKRGSQQDVGDAAAANDEDVKVPAAVARRVMATKGGAKKRRVS